MNHWNLTYSKYSYLIISYIDNRNLIYFHSWLMMLKYTIQRDRRLVRRTFVRNWNVPTAAQKSHFLLWSALAPWVWSYYITPDALVRLYKLIKNNSCNTTKLYKRASSRAVYMIWQHKYFKIKGLLLFWNNSSYVTDFQNIFILTFVIF